MGEPPITVLIPTYNHEKYIEAAIESVVNQTIFDVCRVIVSDDCSQDNTFQIAKRASANFGNITVRRNIRNLGIMPHYATLVASVSTPFVAILEGDDVWLSTRKLELQREILVREPRAGMCFSACVVEYSETGSRRELPHWNNGRNRIVSAVDLIYDNFIATFSNCFFRTALLTDVASQPEWQSGYDWLCNLQIASAADVWFLAAPCTLYRVHRKGAWSAMSRRQRRAAILRTLQSFKEKAPHDLRPYVDDAMQVLV